jgi:hypothetical protein
MGAVVVYVVNAYFSPFANELDSYDVGRVDVDLGLRVRRDPFVHQGYRSGHFFGWVASVPASWDHDTPYWSRTCSVEMVEVRFLNTDDVVIISCRMEG